MEILRKNVLQSVFFLAFCTSLFSANNSIGVQQDAYFGLVPPAMAPLPESVAAQGPAIGLSDDQDEGVSGAELLQAFDEKINETLSIFVRKVFPAPIAASQSLMIDGPIDQKLLNSIFANSQDLLSFQPASVRAVGFTNTTSNTSYSGALNASSNFLLSVNKMIAAQSKIMEESQRSSVLSSFTPICAVSPLPNGRSSSSMSTRSGINSGFASGSSTPGVTGFPTISTVPITRSGVPASPLGRPASRLLPESTFVASPAAKRAKSYSNLLTLVSVGRWFKEAVAEAELPQEKESYSKKLRFISAEKGIKAALDSKFDDDAFFKQPEESRVLFFKNFAGFLKVEKSIYFEKKVFTEKDYQTAATCLLDNESGKVFSEKDYAKIFEEIAATQKS